MLASALDLWRGAPLAELELGSAMRAKTTALEEHRWQVQGDLINTRLALGERAELVSTLQELIGERPFDEGLWCSLMSVLHAVGRTCDALTAFARARTLLVTELGVEPGPALRRVHAAVLEGAEVLGVPSFVGATTTRAVFALHQLPAAVPDFVGRRTELTRIQTLAERAAEGALDHVQIVLVSGSPGVGKTATAVAAGTNMRQACPDGEVLIDLRGSTAQPKDPGAALGDVLTAVGLSTDAIPVSLEHRVALYRSILVERRMLIMLDDAANAEQVTPLVPGLGQSMLIVTSRRWLTGVAADLHLRLEALPRPDALEMLARLIGPDRVEREPEAAASIVEGCGRLPSAIRIAGARLAALSHHPLRFLASRLRDHDRVLDELSVDGMSLRQLFDTCYASLDAQSRRSFWACGLCPSELITAANVGEALRLPVPTADRQLERLIHEGLLSCGGPVSGVPTYRMPVVLHAYARERLADGSRQVRAS